MAESDNISRPVQVFLNTDQFITVSENHQGGGNRDFFSGNNRGFFHHKSAMRKRIQDASETLRRRNQAAGFVIVQMRNDALAKSYRPLKVLFSRNQSFGLVGGGRVGEMFIQCTPTALERLDRRIEERAELNPRMKEDENSGKSSLHPSAYRSELSGIEDIRLPAGFDRISFSAREAYQWLGRPNTLGAYIVELFQPDSSLDPKVAEILIEQFRERLEEFGGVVALPLFSVERMRSNRVHMTIAIHLTTEFDQSFIYFPLDGRLPTHEERPRNMLRMESQDVSIERHQEFLQLMEDEPMVRRVNLPPSVEVPPTRLISQTTRVIELPNSPRSGAPVVGIVDGGVAEIPALSSWRSGGTDSVAAGDLDYSHGTFIAGLVAGGRTLNPHIATTLEPRGCRFFDIPLLPRDGLISNYYRLLSEFIEQLEEEIIRAKSDAGVRVFNLSLGIVRMGRDRDYSMFAKALDDIAVEHNVLFVVAAGNLRSIDERLPWPTDGDEALRLLALRSTVDERITAPAEHLLGISVGALNTPGISGHGPNLPASYTRRGPGVGGVLKPDLAHYGGISSRSDSGSGLYSYESDNTIVDNSGTSFAAPLVASTLATIDHRLEGTVPRETLIALLVHRANRCDAMQHASLRHVARDFVGFGMPAPADECLSDNPHSITLVFSESLVSRKELHFIFSWPKSLVTSTGKCRGQVDLTLVFTPPIDARYDAECIRAQLEAYLHQIQSDPKTGEEKPISRLRHLDSVGSTYTDFATERDMLRAGLKWAPVKRYRLTMPKGRGNSSNWQLVLRSSSRAGFSLSGDGVPFTLAMTISDLEQTAPVYNEIRNDINRRGLQLADITVAHRVRPRS